MDLDGSLAADYQSQTGVWALTELTFLDWALHSSPHTPGRWEPPRNKHVHIQTITRLP